MSAREFQCDTTLYERLTNTEIGFVVTIIGHAKSCVVVIFVAIRDFPPRLESAERHNLNIPSRTLVVRLSAGSAIGKGQSVSPEC